MAGEAQLWMKQWVDTNGDPVAGVKVYTYETGTTSLKTTWRDAARATPSSNPVTGDTRGVVSFYGDGDYRLRLETGDGLFLYDFDPVRITADQGTGYEANHGTAEPGTNTAAQGTPFAKFDGSGEILSYLISTGSGYSTIPLTFKTSTQDGLPTPGVAGTSRYVTTEQRGVWVDSGAHFFQLHGERYDVKEFGAKADGITDDTVPIQDALDACDAGGGGLVFLPRGTYLITQLEIGSNTWLAGSGSEASILRITNTSALAGSLINKDVADGNPYITLSDFTMEREGEPAGLLNILVAFTESDNCVIQRCRFATDQTDYVQNYTGIYLNRCQRNKVLDCNFVNMPDNALVLDGDSGATSGYHLVRGNTCRQVGGWRGRFVYCTAGFSRIEGNIFEATTRADDDHQVVCEVDAADAVGVAVLGNTCVKTELVRSVRSRRLLVAHNIGHDGGDIVVFAGATVGDVSQCQIAHNTIHDANINVRGADCVIHGNYVNDFDGDETFAILVNDGSNNARVTHNTVRNATGGGFGILTRSCYVVGNEASNCGLGPSVAIGRNAGFLFQSTATQSGRGYAAQNWSVGNPNNGYTCDAVQSLTWLDNEGVDNGLSIFGITNILDSGASPFHLLRQRWESNNSSKVPVDINPEGILSASGGSMWYNPGEGVWYIKSDNGSATQGISNLGWKVISVVDSADAQGPAVGPVNPTNTQGDLAVT